MRPVFDDHNDALSEIWAGGDKTKLALFPAAAGDPGLQSAAQ